MTRDEAIAMLAAGGFLAPVDEADALHAAASGEGDRLASLVARRTTGEPLAWITGRAMLAGTELVVHPDVYVPRPHTAALAELAATLLPDDGVAVDLCTGCGAIAAVLRDRRPGATVIGTDVDERAVACARANGVDARLGDLFAAVPPEVVGRVDVVTGVVPYVPTSALGLLHRDALAFEPVSAFDGGDDGCTVLRRAITGAAAVLRPGGALALELGAEQVDLLAGDLAAAGYFATTLLLDEEADVRGVVARR